MENFEGLSKRISVGVSEKLLARKMAMIGRDSRPMLRGRAAFQAK